MLVDYSRWIRETNDISVTKDGREELGILSYKVHGNACETALCYLKVGFGYLKMCILNSRVTIKKKYRLYDETGDMMELCKMLS